MRVRILPPILAGLTLTLGIFAFPLDSNAAKPNYVCMRLNGVWTSWFRNSKGTISPLLRWKNDQISNWPPRKRCIKVSDRMNYLSNNGLLNYLSGGIVNSNPVVCGVRRLGDKCTRGNVILTLPPHYDPNNAIDKLTDSSLRARGIILELSNNGNETELTNETLELSNNGNETELTNETLELSAKNNETKKTNEQLGTSVDGQTYVNIKVWQQILETAETPISPQ